MLYDYTCTHCCMTRLYMHTPCCMTGLYMHTPCCMTRLYMHTPCCMTRLYMHTPCCMTRLYMYTPCCMTRLYMHTPCCMTRLYMHTPCCMTRLYRHAPCCMTTLYITAVQAHTLGKMAHFDTFLHILVPVRITQISADFLFFASISTGWIILYEKENFLKCLNYFLRWGRESASEDVLWPIWLLWSSSTRPWQTRQWLCCWFFRLRHRILEIGSYKQDGIAKCVHHQVGFWPQHKIQARLCTYSHNILMPSSLLSTYWK